MSTFFHRAALERGREHHCTSAGGSLGAQQGTQPAGSHHGWVRGFGGKRCLFFLGGGGGDAMLAAMEDGGP